MSLVSHWRKFRNIIILFQMGKYIRHFFHFSLIFHKIRKQNELNAAERLLGQGERKIFVAVRQFRWSHQKKFAAVRAFGQRRKKLFFTIRILGQLSRKLFLTIRGLG